MFYYCIKWLARCSLFFFFRKRFFCGFPLHTLRGPAIIAANHPNSLLDAVVIACRCRQPVHFTVRSDMFNNPLFGLLLKSLHGIPVYRRSEEKEKLRKNFNSIDHCRKILKKGGIIIIFSEGITLHDWKLKPLKSGTAKIVQHALCDPQLINTLRIMPLGLTYNDYKHPGKTLIVQAGEIFCPGQLPFNTNTGEWKHRFNEVLFERMKPLVPEMTSAHIASIALWQTLLTQYSRKFDCITGIARLHHTAAVLSDPGFRSPFATKLIRRYYSENKTAFVVDVLLVVILCIPALIGYTLNGAFYFPLRHLACTKTKGTIFYDSLLFGLITTLYPVYILLTSFVLWLTTPIAFWLGLIIIPVTAWISEQWHIRLLKVRNYTVLKGTLHKQIAAVLSGDPL